MASKILLAESENIFRRLRGPGGRSGKGFAVAENEVEELASQTSNATENIGQSIQAIQMDTQKSVDAISEITQIIDKINEISTIIATAVEEQQVVTAEIS